MTADLIADADALLDAHTKARQTLTKTEGEMLTLIAELRERANKLEAALKPPEAPKVEEPPKPTRAAPGQVRDGILALLHRGPEDTRDNSWSVKELASELAAKPESVAAALRKLASKTTVERNADGTWRMAKDSAAA